MVRTPAKRVFTAFDFDHDESLRTLLVGQSKHPDTEFEICDWSIREPFPSSNWKAKVRDRIRRCEQMIVICGQHTHTATGVSAELEIAQDEGKPDFLLRGYGDKTCYKPTAAKATDKMYTWTWDNLKLLIKGNR
jgi:hypothetical protein